MASGCFIPKVDSPNSISCGLKWICQQATKGVSNSTGLMNSVLTCNLANRQVNFGGKFKSQKNCNQCYSSKQIFGLFKASYILPEYQAVKLTFFTPCSSKVIVIL